MSDAKPKRETQPTKSVATNTPTDTSTTATPSVQGGWFRPFCLSLMVLLLISLCAFGGLAYLLVQQVISVPQSLLAAISPKPTAIIIQASTVLERVQSLSELLTTRYSYSSLITSERDMPPVLKGLYGDRLMMVAVGRVNAGVDVRKVTVESTTATSVKLVLPPAVLLDCFLDEKASYVLARDTGFFARPVPTLDQEARRFAVVEFRKMALEAGVLADAQSRSKTIVQEFVRNLGFAEVTVTVTLPDATSLPDSCK